jgi:predicted phage terminase large subunit-like protein
MLSQTDPPEILWQPNPGPQTEFLSSPADEVLYGGAAGGGKSAATVALPLRWIDHPRFNALVLRRETPQLRDLLDKSEALYTQLGARLNQTTGAWRFPSGARVWFTHCEHEQDVHRFDGHEFHLVCFDELTHFTEKQYLAIRARIRGTDPSLPRWTRSTTNPGGAGHEWVFARFRPWLDPTCERPARFGRLRWYRGDEEVSSGATDALSRTFIPARLEDNPHVTGEYRAQLLQLDPVRRAQLLGGDWLKKPSPKDYWDRSKITHRASIPLMHDVQRRVRCWDFAASTTGDWTVGVRGSLTKAGLIVLEHIIRFRGKPDEVHRRFGETAAADRVFDARCEQWIPEDPGQAGKDQVRSFQNENAGIPIFARRPTGDKLTRFRPASARATTGTLEVVQGAWNGDLHDELEEIPLSTYDDQMDGVSDVVGVLTGAVVASYDAVSSYKPRLPQPRI